MRKRIIHFAVWMGLALAGPVSAWAGDCPETDRELERLRALMERRLEQLEQCRVPHAKGLVEQAQRSLREADKRSDQGQCRRAGLQVEAAKGLLERAARLCSETDQQQDQVFDFLSDTDRLMQRLMEDSAGISPDCRRMLQAAEEQQANAWRQFRAKKPRFALNLSGVARRTLDSARRCVSEGGAGPQVERILERTDWWLERVEEVLPGGKGGLLDKARDLSKRAWSTFQDNRPRQALQLSFQARRTAVRLLSEQNDLAEGSSVERMLNAAEAYVDEVADMAGGERRERNLVRDAQGLLTQARSQLRRGELQGATASVRSALALALQAAESKGPGGRR